MHHRRIAACLAAACLAAPASAAATVPPEQLSGSINAGTTWIKTKQNVTTGAFTGFGGDWSLIAFSAAGIHPADARRRRAPRTTSSASGATRRGPPRPTTRRSRTPPGYVATDFERAILMADAGGLQPTRLSAQSNLVAQLAGLYQPNGAYGAPGLFNGTVFGVLAMARTKAPASILQRGADVIRANVHNDGGWTYTLTTTPAQKAANSDIDMTGAALAALCNAGVPVLRRDRQRRPGLPQGQARLRHRRLQRAVRQERRLQRLGRPGPQRVRRQPAVGGVDHRRRQDPARLPALAAAHDRRQRRLVQVLRRPSPTRRTRTCTRPRTRSRPWRARASPPTRRRCPAYAPAPAVAAGTAVPFVLALDDGHGGVGLCRTTAPAGAPLTDVLSCGQGRLDAAGCVTELTDRCGHGHERQRQDRRQRRAAAGSPRSTAAPSSSPPTQPRGVRRHRRAAPAAQRAARRQRRDGAGHVPGDRRRHDRRRAQRHLQRRAGTPSTPLASPSAATTSSSRPTAAPAPRSSRARAAPSACASPRASPGERTGTLQLLSDAAPGERRADRHRHDAPGRRSRHCAGTEGRHRRTRAEGRQRDSRRRRSRRAPPARMAATPRSPASSRQGPPQGLLHGQGRGAPDPRRPRLRPRQRRNARVPPSASRAVTTRFAPAHGRSRSRSAEDRRRACRRASGRRRRARARRPRSCAGRWSRWRSRRACRRASARSTRSRPASSRRSAITPERGAQVAVRALAQRAQLGVHQARGLAERDQPRRRAPSARRWRPPGAGGSPSGGAAAIASRGSDGLSRVARMITASSSAALSGNAR